MNNQANQQGPDQAKPWYRQFWPWFIIALPATVVVASFITLWIAVSNPDYLVVSDNQYQQIKRDLKASPEDQERSQDKIETDAGNN